MAEKLTPIQQESLDNMRADKMKTKEDAAYKNATVYPETEDIVTKLVPPAAAIQVGKGIGYLGKKLSGDKEQSKKAGGPIKKMVRGGGIESRGKTKGRFV